MSVLRTCSKAFILGAVATVLLLTAVTQARAESDAHEVMVATKGLFAIKVALGLYYADHGTYPAGSYTCYEDLASVLRDRYGLPYMELPEEWEGGGSFDFVNYSGDREDFVINIRAADGKGTIVSVTPDRVVVR